jgi:small subunit ribosomal protein S27Ae
MQVFVKSLSNRTTLLTVEPSWTVSQVKEALFALEGVDAEFQTLHHAGSILEDAETLAQYQIEEANTLYLSLALAGGKKKKKVFASKKKNKHKHKNVKLSTLLLYSIDSQGKIIRNRKQCSQPSCGPGVFMARHFDRHYCGRCQDMIKVDKSEILKIEKKVKTVEVKDAGADGKKGGKAKKK